MIQQGVELKSTKTFDLHVQQAVPLSYLMILNLERNPCKPIIELIIVENMVKIIMLRSIIMVVIIIHH